MKILILLVLLCIVGCGDSHDPQLGKCYKHVSDDVYSQITAHIFKKDGREIEYIYSSSGEKEINSKVRSRVDFIEIYPDNVSCSDFEKHKEKTRNLIEMQKLHDRIDRLEKIIKEDK